MMTRFYRPSNCGSCGEKLIAIAAAPKPSKIGIKSKGRGGYVRAARRTGAKRFQREILIFNLVRYTAPL